MTHSSGPALHVQGLEFSYNHNPLFRNLNFSLRFGEMLAVLGPNGVGKSTLLKCISGELLAYQGKIEKHQSLQSPLSTAYLAQKSSIDLDFPICVEEVVELGILGRKRAWQRLTAHDRERLHHWIEMVGLQGHKRTPIGHLSGGQLQRALLARALAQEAKLLILDEPFAGVDLPTEEFLMNQLIRFCKDTQGCVLFVHHNFFTLPKAIDRVVVLGRHQSHVGSATQLLKPESLKHFFSSPQEGLNSKGLIDDSGKNR